MTPSASAVQGQPQNPTGFPVNTAGKTISLLLVLFMVSLVAIPTLAQETTIANSEVNITEEQKAEAQKTETKEAAELQAEMLNRLERLEQQAAVATKENELLKARLAQKEEASTANEITNQLAQSVNVLEDAEFDRMQAKERNLKVYGFADFQWYKFFYSKNSLYDGSLNDKNSFTVGHWHMYLEKRVSDKFRFLGEVRFLFQPYGDETDFGLIPNQYTTDDEIANAPSFARANTQTQDWVDAYYFDWGAISIQQIWLEYKYSDLFGVRAGNFLTPYGIWNVDHASTVVIPGHRPFLITASLLPESQTGLNFFGRIFPSDSTAIDYAITLSNGRGPTSKVYDLDESKAIGLSLSFSYDGPVSLSLGSYLYLGEYTDVVRNAGYDIATARYDYKTEVAENYLEKTMAFHLKIKWEGLLLQGEYVRSIARYKEDGRPILFEESAFGPALYETDFHQHAGYGLVAFQIPVDAIHLSPFFIYEYQKPADRTFLPQGHNYGGGLNWRITPTVVLKADIVYHRDNGARWGYPKSKLHYGVVSSQLAVSY